MIVLIRKKVLATAGALLLILAAAWVFRGPSQSVFSPQEAGLSRPVVIDAGHGGEDGGAVSANGVSESRLNLAIAQKLQETMAFLGRETIMTRTGDTAIYSDDAGTLRQKKVSDLQNRVKLVNETAGSRLISIHQNSLPGYPTVCGAQVFYNTVEGSRELAEEMQNVLNQTVNSGNEKQAKKIAPTIYLMKNVTKPAILVECGFLSNPNETGRLQTDEYQLLLAVSIAAGYVNSYANEGVT